MALGAVRFSMFGSRGRRAAAAGAAHAPSFVPPQAEFDPPFVDEPEIRFEPPVEPEGAGLIPIAEFLLRARQLGIMDRRILAAIESVPRQPFLDAAARSGPLFAERPQPIACGQLSTPPIIVARILTALGPGDRDRVLEIGTGTGYLSAVLSRLVRRVYSVDRFRTLIDAAQQRFATLGIENVATLFADGRNGWPDRSPFDSIVATASAESVPTALIEQLTTSGVLIMPIGPADGVQMLTRFERTDRRMVETPICPVRLLPLIAGKAQRL